METVIVTRHPALVQLLEELGLCPAGTPVVSHVAPADIAGKHVIGVLPLSLAALAAQVTELPLALPPDLRGKELDLETLKKVAGAPVTYKVTVV